MKANHLCKTPFCRDSRKKNKKGQFKSQHCSACESRIWRKNNPEKASFIQHKSNAKYRGYRWELTFEQFMQFAVENDLIKKAGRKSMSLHIDRIDPTGHYTVDNIQALPNCENVRKQHRDTKLYKHDVEGKTGKFVHIVTPEIKEDDPF